MTLLTAQALSFHFLQTWGLGSQSARIEFVVLLLWSYFHFEVNKRPPFQSQKKKGKLPLEFSFSSSPLSLKLFVCIFSELVPLFLQSQSGIRSNNLLLVCSNLEAAKFMQFSCSSCFMFHGVLIGSPCCTLHKYFTYMYMCVYICIYSSFCLFLCT